MNSVKFLKMFLDEMTTGKYFKLDTNMMKYLKTPLRYGNRPVRPCEGLN